MPAPVLGVVARLVLSSGARQAAKKYGQAAVTKAREELAKYQSALSRRASDATHKEGLGPALRGPSAAARRSARQRERDALGTRLDRQRSARGLPRIEEEIPLKFAKGGSIDGKAIKGLTKGSRRK